MTQVPSSCCNSFRNCSSDLGQSIETNFNKAVDKIAGKTFDCITKLKTSDTDSTIAKVGKIFAAVLGTITIVPIAGVFLAAGVQKLWNSICDSLRDTPHFQTSPRIERPAR